MRGWREFPWLVAIVVVIAAAAFVQRPTSTGTVDFDHVTAEFTNGYDGWRSWTVDIRRDGLATLKSPYRRLDSVRPEQNEPNKVFRLTQSQLAGLSDELSRQQFSTIDPEFRAGLTDLQTLVLTVEERGKSHSVLVYGPQLMSARPMVKRFLFEWASLLELVPSPNEGKGDGPDLWLKVAATNHDK